MTTCPDAAMDAPVFQWFELLEPLNDEDYKALQEWAELEEVAA